MPNYTAIELDIESSLSMPCLDSVHYPLVIDDIVKLSFILTHVAGISDLNKRSWLEYKATICLENVIGPNYGVEGLASQLKKYINGEIVDNAITRASSSMPRLWNDGDTYANKINMITSLANDANECMSSLLELTNLALAGENCHCSSNEGVNLIS